MDGWTLYDEEPGEWGAWISNGATAISAAADREVKTIYHEAVMQTTGYRYKHYRYTNASGTVYYTYGTGYADSMGFSGYWETKETSVAGRLGTYKVYDGVQSYGKAGDFWFFEEEIKTVNTAAYTEYQYRTRSRTYYFYRWQSWSDWQDELITESDSVDVETRILYAVDTSKLSTGIRLESASVIPMIPKTGLQIQYQGNGKDADWDSSDISVASVDSSGYISAHSDGTAVISAVTASGDSYSFSVVVKNWQGLSFPQDLITIKEEAFENGAFEYVDLAASRVKNVGDRAFSNNTALRLVRANNQVSFGDQVFANTGNVYFACEGEGKTTDYAESEKIPFYVIGPEIGYIDVSSIIMHEEQITLSLGSTYQLSCDILPQDATNQSITWSSSNPAIANVTSNGLVSAISDGTVVISATSRNNHSVKAECRITINPILVDSVKLNKQSLTIYTGNTQTITATVLPDNAKNKTIRWTSSNELIAYVDDNGVVRGVGSGTATITATSTDGSNKSASCTVTVKATDIVDDSMFVSVYVDQISETNATIHAKVSLPHNPTIAGYYFGTSSSNLQLSATEDSSGMPLSNQIIWYDLKKWGKSLAPATTYYYQFYIVYDGVTYRSSIRSFKTNGTSGEIIDESMFTTVYVDEITETNAVIHTKVSLPHNPTKAGYYFGTDISNLVLSATEDASNMPLNNQIIWYDLNKWGKTLTPCTRYYYMFYIVYDGITYKTDIHSFYTAGGSNSEETILYLTLGAGESYTITLPDYYMDRTVTWSSEDTSVAVVDANGVITAGKEGTTRIVGSAYSASSGTTKLYVCLTVNPIRYHAVIVGNYDYDLDLWDKIYNATVDMADFFGVASDGKIEPAPGAKNDTECLAMAMRRNAHNFGQTPDVHYYLDIPKSSVLSNIRSGFAGSDYNDINILYIAGHGSASTHYISLYNGDRISPAELRNALSGIKGNTIVVICTCYSGEFTNFTSGLSGGNFYVLTACMKTENVHNKYKKSAYTNFGYFFLLGMGWDDESQNTTGVLYADRQGNNDNKVTLDELFTYLDYRVTDDADLKGGTQHITHSWSVGQGNIVIYNGN